ncbi:hypothetical protein MPDQ_000546 [Monascus purpureus]|uniref:Uncharacterized protein n=1 Tax=Monascus purpureus TaxID=5098 RepID=A0A507R6B2_MONPU|nr:hypothetical protein MPDQ_000546 [Monascus purpureus]BDD64126.1 hypothetical protein MAP00_008971 [Monascus purpureus]
MRYLISLLSLACAAVARPAERDTFSVPTKDSFYHAPWDLAYHQPGHVFRSRSFISRYTGNVSESYQYYYRTNDNLNKPIGTVGTVFVPKNPSSPPKILVFNSPEDAVNVDCGPSWVWVQGTPTRDTASNELYLEWALSQGYYLVNTDAEGPNGAWLVGKIEGHSMLDGVRAAIDLLHLPQRTPIAMFGYSGGAHTTVWASSLAASYAPDLNIVGAAYGGTPVDLTATLESVNGTVESQLAVLGVLGLAKGYKSIQTVLPSILTPLGKNITAQLSDLCPSSTSYQIIYYGSIDPLFTCNPLNVPAIANVLRQESLLTNVTGHDIPVPKFPRFQFQGKLDEVVPFSAVDQYVEQQCNKGADIRFVAFNGTSHFSAELGGLVASLQFLGDALEDRLQKVKCGSPIPAPSIGSAEADAFLGPELAAIAKNVMLTG